MGGKLLSLCSEDYFNFSLDCGGRHVQFSFTTYNIKFTNSSSRNSATYNKEIIIPFDVDLTNLKTTLAAVEDEGTSPDFVIDKIKGINPYVGINECYNLYTNKEPKDITREKSEKFFYYY
jgi:hypothetical protein